jgi:hypothetical protein
MRERTWSSAVFPLPLLLTMVNTQNDGREFLAIFSRQFSPRNAGKSSGMDRS